MFNDSSLLPTMITSVISLLDRLTTLLRGLIEGSWGGDFLKIMPAWASYIISCLLIYPFLCSALRFHRSQSTQRQFNYPNRESFAKMTNTDAQQIMKVILQWEFPRTAATSVQFALFKTFGIPTISKLLVATKGFSTPETSSKRYEDTTVLIGEFCLHGPTSDRGVKAIARMNYLHSSYIKAGQISNADLLYTLSVFVTEPIAWIACYEWRPLNDMEICAIATFWKSIGDAMEIEYKGYLARDSWKDGIEFYEDIKSWAHEYEIEHMVPTATNKKTADELVPLLLFYTPHFMRPFLSQMVGVMMGERLRDSMLYPNPSMAAVLVTSALLLTRRFILRYLTLPRILPLVEFSEKDPKTRRYYHLNYLVHPYYNKPAFWNRWGPIAWFTWACGGIVPSAKNGNKYMPQGYLFEEVGPENRKGKGIRELREQEEKIKRERLPGCPFA